MHLKAQAKELVYQKYMPKILKGKTLVKNIVTKFCLMKQNLTLRVVITGVESYSKTVF